MEFQEFCRQKERLCNTYDSCSDCLINVAFDCNIKTCNVYCMQNPKEADEIVSEWAKEHPVVTNADKFREVFGFNIMTKPEKEEDFTMSRDEFLSRIEKWLEQEYKPPRKEGINETD